MYRNRTGTCPLPYFGCIICWPLIFFYVIFAPLKALQIINTYIKTIFVERVFESFKCCGKSFKTVFRLFLTAYIARNRIQFFAMHTFYGLNVHVTSCGWQGRHKGFITAIGENSSSRKYPKRMEPFYFMNANLFTWSTLS